MAAPTAIFSLKGLGSLTSGTRTAECDRESRSTTVVTGCDVQRCADLLHKQKHEFHSESGAVRRIKSCRQSRSVVNH